MPPKGGAQQQLRRQRLAAGVGDERPSQLANFLLEQWSFGQLSTPMVQRIAHHAHADGVDLPEVVRLAGLGAGGRLPGNTHRDLLAATGDMPFKRALSTFMVPYRHGLRGVRAVPQEMLLPHLVVAELYEAYPDEFSTRLLGSDGLGDTSRLQSFWESMEQRHPGVRGNAMLDVASWQQCFIPLAVHGDGVPVSGVGKSWSKSFESYSFNSLLGRGSTLQFQFLIAGIFKHLASTSAVGHTQRRVWRKMCWSLTALWHGVHPAEDEYGRAWPAGSRQRARQGSPLCGGYRGVVWALRGDLEYFSYTLNFPHFNARAPCALCAANADTRPHNDFREGAAWRGTVYDEAAFRARLQEREGGIHQIFGVPSVGVYTVTVDLLHVKHLGVDAFFMGSVLWVLTHEVMGGALVVVFSRGEGKLSRTGRRERQGNTMTRLGSGPCLMPTPGTAEENTQALWEQLQGWYREHRCHNRFQNLRLSMFEKEAHYPRLKGKAAEIRSLVPALRDIAGELLGASRTHRAIKLALGASATMEEILDAHAAEPVLPRDDVVRFQQAAFRYLQLQTMLAAESAAAGALLWQVTVKAHWLAHGALLSGVMNPRLGWTYAGEDFQQRVRAIMQKCLRGTRAELATRKLMDKYVTGMHVKMKGLGRVLR